MTIQHTTLKYKSSLIAEAESHYKLNFFKAVEHILDQSYSMTELIFVFVAGGGSREEFDERWDEDSEALAMDVMTALNSNGFLGPKMKPEEFRKLMAKEAETLKANAKTTPTSGEAAKK